MKKVRESVYDRDGGVLGKLLDNIMSMRADDQTLQIAGQDPDGVFNAFSPPDLRA